MKLQLLNADLFVCPHCVRKEGVTGEINLRLVEEQRIVIGDDIKSGVLICPTCRYSFRIVDGIAIFGTSQGAGKYEESDTALGYVQTHYRDVITKEDSIASQLKEYEFTGFYSGPPFDNYYLALIELLDDRLTADSFVLDLGCSVGRLSRELAAKAKFVIGADPSFAQVRLAREILLTGKIRVRLGRKGLPGSMLGEHEVLIDAGHESGDNVEFIVADEMSLPFRAGAFDALCASAVIDRVPDADAFIRNLEAVSRDGMTLLLTSPFDWDTRTTPKEKWLSLKGYGNSEGASEVALKDLMRRRRYSLIRERNILWSTFSHKRHHSVWSVYSAVFEHWDYEIQKLDAREAITETLVEAYQRVWAESEVYREEFSAEEVRDTLSDSGLFLTASRRFKSEVVGFAGGTRLNQENEHHRRAYETLFRALGDDQIFYLRELGVLEEFEGAGLGSDLLKRLLSHAKAKGHYTHTLMTNYDNEKALALYKRLGFSFLYDQSGLVSEAVTQRRVGGEERTDFRPYLYCVDEFKKVALGDGRAVIIVFVHPQTMRRNDLLPFAEQISKLFGKAFWRSDEPEKGWPVPSIMRRLPETSLALLAFEADSREPVGYGMFEQVRWAEQPILFVSSIGVSGGGVGQSGKWQGSGLGLEMLREALRRIPSDFLVARTQNGGVARLLRKLNPARILPIDAAYTGENAALLEVIKEGVVELRQKEIDPSTGVSRGVYREGKLGDYEESVNSEYIQKFDKRMLEIDAAWDRHNGDAVILTAVGIVTPY